MLKLVKILTGVLIFAIVILSIFSINVSASSLPNYSELKQIHNEPTATSTSIDNRIKEIKNITSKQPQNKLKDWLNPFVYDDYGIIAYGVPSGDFYKRTDGRMRNTSNVAGEYKYLGVNYDGVLMTNDRYYSTGTTGATFSSVEDYKKTKWEPIGGASGTWENISLAQRNQLAHTNFTDDDYITKGEVPLTLKELLGDTLYSRAYVQCAPTMWTVCGSVRLEYDNTNWNTVIIQPLAHNSTITASILAKDTYIIKAGQTEVDVPYQVEGTVGGDIVNAGKIDQLKAMDFVSLTVPVHGDFSNGKPTQYGDYKKTYHREYLKEGDNTIKLTGSATVTTNYSEDKPITAMTSKIIHIIVEPEPVIPETGKIEVINLDDKNAEISSYTIPNVPFNTPKVVTKQDIDGYEYNGSYQTGSPLADYAYFKTQMKSVISQTVTLSTKKEHATVYFWYTSKAEVIEPPVEVEKCDLTANLKDMTVNAGQTFTIAASVIDSLRHDITSYSWSAPGATKQEPNNNLVTLMYPSEGIYDLSLNVTCSENNNAVAICKIKVEEPTPTAVIDVGGITKENRKININSSSSTIDNGSEIDWSKNVWKIEPVTDSGAKWEMGVRLPNGTVKTIDQNTDQSFLNGLAKFNFQARYSGQYNIFLTVTSTKNKSNTTENRLIVTKDYAPIANYDCNFSVYRDYMDPSGSTYPKWGKFLLNDKSFSSDGDTICKRTWGYRYNSNNNKDSKGNENFSDEPSIFKYEGDILEPFSGAGIFYTFNESSEEHLKKQLKRQRLIVDNDNDLNIELWTYDVGAYGFELTVEESIPDNETIKELLKDSDIRRTTVKDW